MITGNFIGGSLLFTYITEILQFFSEGRTPQFRDYGIDCLGIGLAFGVYGVAKIIQNRRRLPADDADEYR